MKKQYSEKMKTGEITVKQIPGPVFITSGSITGEIFLQWDAVDNARHYIIECSVNSGKKWQVVDMVKDPHISMQNLKKGKQYFFRIAAAFLNDQSPWSKTAIKHIK
jgi:hypothetical protein